MTDHLLKRELSSLAFENKFASLPDAFFTNLTRHPYRPYLVGVSKPMLATTGLDISSFNDASFLEIFKGNKLGNNSYPLASIYSAHQFGVWAGQLGDGRAILLGDVAVTQQSARMEIRLKGGNRWALCMV